MIISATILDSQMSDFIQRVLNPVGAKVLNIELGPVGYQVVTFELAK